MNTHYLQQAPEEWEHKACVFAALGDGTRQKMLLLFEVGETIPLKTLVEVLPLSRSAVVHHVTVLEQAGLLVARRQGREVGYTLNTAPLITRLENVLGYAKSLSGVSGAASGAASGTALAAEPKRSIAGRDDALSGDYSALNQASTGSKTTALFVPLSAQELAHD